MLNGTLREKQKNFICVVPVDPGTQLRVGGYLLKPEI